MKKTAKNGLSKDQVNELVYQALEHELGGVQVYLTALKCVQNEDLREEWEKYAEATATHVEKLQGVCAAMGLDPERETPGRQVVRHLGKSMVKAMQMALKAGPPAAAEIVAAECVTLAETGSAKQNLTHPANES
jgi:rubrerythrin